MSNWSPVPLAPFVAGCIYFKELDWLVCLTVDCSYKAAPTKHPQLEMLVYESNVVGIKVIGFSTLPSETRQKILESTRVDLDDIEGIEDLWILNANEQRAEISAFEEAFLENLRKQKRG